MSNATIERHVSTLKGTELVSQLAGVTLQPAGNRDLKVPVAGFPDTSQGMSADQYSSIVNIALEQNLGNATFVEALRELRKQARLTENQPHFQVIGHFTHLRNDKTRHLIVQSRDVDRLGDILDALIHGTGIAGQPQMTARLEQISPALRQSLIDQGMAVETEGQMRLFRMKFRAIAGDYVRNAAEALVAEATDTTLTSLESASDGFGQVYANTSVIADDDETTEASDDETVPVSTMDGGSVNDDPFAD